MFTVQVIYLNDSLYSYAVKNANKYCVKEVKIYHAKFLSESDNVDIQVHNKHKF